MGGARAEVGGAGAEFGGIGGWVVGPGEGVASSSVYRRASVAYSTMTHSVQLHHLIKVQWNPSLYEDTPELRTPL